jgi:hypothetical protein
MALNIWFPSYEVRLTHLWIHVIASCSAKWSLLSDMSLRLYCQLREGWTDEGKGPGELSVRWKKSSYADNPASVSDDCLVLAPGHLV